jgi:aldehyde:ferredoxin oxidoreductase
MQIPFFRRGARINLTTRNVQFETLNDRWYRNFLGGKGLGALLLFNNLGASVDPLSSENVLIFITGPLTGSSFPSASRGVLVTKSPLTGTFLDSNIGGNFGKALKSTGLDYLIIEGKSDRPIWLMISDTGIVFRDAQALWGKSTSETELALKKEIAQRGAEIATIGQGGEQQVYFASIACGQRMFGRGGAGAVMGSKNLKALALLGRSELPWFKSDAFLIEARKAREKLQSNQSTKKGGIFPQYGTSFTTAVTNSMGVLPTRNWQEGVFEKADSIKAEEFFKKKSRSKTCYQCPIACSMIMKSESESDTESTIRRPEYETIYAFGPNCGIGDVDTIINANHLCEEYGLDTISCGVVISYLMECQQRGVVADVLLNPLPKFGDADSLLETIKYIGEGGKPDNPVTKGVKRLSEDVGQSTERFAMCVKGLELPGYDPRGMKGMALLYATADRGGCHVRGSTLRAELLMNPNDRFIYDGKAALAAGMQPIYAMMDSYSGCLFSAFALVIDDYACALSALFEENITAQDLIDAGKRIWNLTRYFNCREGFSREDDVLPARLFEDPVPFGPTKGQVVDRTRFEAMKDEYYQILGWDIKTGVPMIDPGEYKI